MAEIPARPQMPAGQGAPRQQQGVDIKGLIETYLQTAAQGLYDPKQLQSLGQALQSILKVSAALRPRPSPQQAAMQPGPMEQLAQLDLIRKQRQAQAMQQGRMRPNI